MDTPMGTRGLRPKNSRVINVDLYTLEVVHFFPKSHSTKKITHQALCDSSQLTILVMWNLPVKYSNNNFILIEAQVGES